MIIPSKLTGWGRGGGGTPKLMSTIGGWESYKMLTNVDKGVGG